MSFKADIRGSLYPWLNLSPDDNRLEALQSFLRIRTALDDLLDFKIGWQDYLDIVQSEGVNMEDYLGIAEENFISIGF